LEFLDSISAIHSPPVLQGSLSKTRVAAVAMGCQTSDPRWA
jgi:hypothetical protein